MEGKFQVLKESDQKGEAIVVQINSKVVRTADSNSYFNPDDCKYFLELIDIISQGRDQRRI